MRWEDERYVRLYTRDTVDWLGLSFIAQGLFCLILRKVDRAGLLRLGKPGKRGVAIAIGFGGEWPRLEPALEELLVDGCIQIRGEHLVIPNFIEAQEATQSDAQRKRESRARDRDLKASANVTTPDILSESVTDGHDTGQKVTSGHNASQVVTTGHSVPSLAVPNQEDPPLHRAGAREAGVGAPTREQLLAREYPATSRLLDALQAAGLPMRHASKHDDRVRLEQLVAGIDLDRAVAVVRASFAAIPKAWLGWHEDALVAATVAPGAIATASAGPDLAWLDGLPADRRAEAHAAWAARTAEVEATFHPSRAPSVLVSAAEALRQEFAS